MAVDAPRKTQPRFSPTKLHWHAPIVWVQTPPVASDESSLQRCAPTLACCSLLLLVPPLEPETGSPTLFAGLATASLSTSSLEGAHAAHHQHIRKWQVAVLANPSHLVGLTLTRQGTLVEPTAEASAWLSASDTVRFVTQGPRPHPAHLPKRKHRLIIPHNQSCQTQFTTCHGICHHRPRKKDSNTAVGTWLYATCTDLPCPDPSPPAPAAGAAGS